MKTKNKSSKKPNKVKQIYDQMQEKKTNVYWQQNKPGKKGEGARPGKFKSRPRTVGKQFDRF